MPTGLRVKGKAVVPSIDKISAFVLRYGLVLVVFWIGCLKFTAYESKGVFLRNNALTNRSAEMSSKIDPTAA